MGEDCGFTSWTVEVHTRLGRVHVSDKIAYTRDGVMLVGASHSYTEVTPTEIMGDQCYCEWERVFVPYSNIEHVLIMTPQSDEWVHHG